MEYQVFIQNQSEQNFIASVVRIPNLTVEGSTEIEAIALAKAALELRLSTGKFVTIEVNPVSQPKETVTQMKYVGIFADDSTFDDFMEKLAVIRQQANSVKDE